ncbi:phosphate-binding protein [Geminocystis sp. NIES-3708]|nr:phosphate-binding protein [Geminocystis sp. NIES-3708]
MTLRQLRKVASLYNIPRYSRMRKAQLLTVIQEKETLFISADNINSDNKTNLLNQANIQEAQKMEASKFEVGQDDLTGGPLADVDQDFGELPGGYGENRIVLMPRDPQWAYTYWDIPIESKENLRRQGGQQLALRLYDVTDIDLNHQSPHNIQEYLCDELAREWYLPVPVSDRDYVIDIGYRCFDGRWLVLARSVPVRVPPVYPSDWVEDIFVTIPWEEDLRTKTVYKLTPPAKKAALAAQQQQYSYHNQIHDEIFGLAQSVEAQRVAGSLYGSMQQAPSSSIPENALSSYVFPSGAGLWAGRESLASGSGIGLGLASGSGIGLGLASGSGIGLGLASGSGAGFSADVIPNKPRKFWLIADAELIVYGATEPDAKVTIGGREIKLNPDGTFRFQMSFQDGNIDYPIVAVAADGEQTRSVHMTFDRHTPSRNTNTKEEAVLEWFPPIR